MKKLIPTLLFFSTISFLVFSFGQNSNLEQCIGIDTAVGRLACYDSIATPEYCSSSQESWRTECGGDGDYQLFLAQQQQQQQRLQTLKSRLQQRVKIPEYCFDNQEAWRIECGGNGNQLLFLAQQQQQQQQRLQTLRSQLQERIQVPEYCLASQYAWLIECGGSGFYRR